MWNLKYNAHELLYETNKQTHIHREHICVCQGGGRKGEGYNGNMVLPNVNYYYVDWINNKILLYSTGNYIQVPVINHTRKKLMN